MLNHLYIMLKDGTECADCGAAILDEQHRAIIATVNSLYFFIQSGHGLDGLKPTLNILILYMAFHFKTEEMVLIEHEYPEVGEYKAIGNAVITDLKEVSLEATLNREPNLLLQFLKSWWPTHINGEHGKFKTYFHGLQPEREKS